ncbi:MAG: flippase [Candidatus Pacearchaeota archaeon]|nr:flippase [Candidatus Pacearchaeota archaeon]
MNKDDKEIEKGLNLIAKSSLFVFFAIFISKILTYLYRIVLARYYGPETYGLFSLALVIFSFFMAFTSLGLFDGLLRFIPIYRGQGEKDKIKYLFKFTSNVLIFTSILTCAIIYFNAEFISTNLFHDTNLIIYLKVFAFLIPIQAFTNLFFGIIRSHEKIKPYSFGINILENTSKLLFLGLFIFLGIFSSKAVSFSYFLAILTGLIFSYIYCKIKIPYIFLKYKISKENKLKIRKKLFAYSWPLIFYGIISALMYYFDTLLIGYFQDSYWTGIYNSAVPLATLLLLATEMFMQMFFPLITREISSKRDTVVKELSKQITKWIFMINLPLTILITLFPGVFINLFFGADYLPAINVLRILVLGQFVFSITLVSNSLMLSYGKSKILFTNLVLVSIINFVLNWILIPLHGIEGAAFATFTSLILLSSLILLENYLLHKILPFRRKMFTIFLSALIPAIALYKVSQIIEVNLVWLILLGISFCLVYLLLILLTKSFDKNDLSIVKMVFRK